jgi:hypothetical protein
MSNADKIAEIYHRINKLKLKAGAALSDTRAGFIDPTAIKRAQVNIDNQESKYEDEIQSVLKQLEYVWDEVKGAKSRDAAEKPLDRMHNFANNVKDLAQTYNYGLMAHFAGSLSDFCEKIDPANPNHIIITQAHIDVMNIVMHEHMKDLEGEKAEELKKIVAKAIEKYSPENG